MSVRTANQEEWKKRSTSMAVAIAALESGCRRQGFQRRPVILHGLFDDAVGQRLISGHAVTPAPGDLALHFCSR